MREHGLQAGDIARVDTHVPQVTVDHLRYPLPRDEREARFSMQYGVAVVIVQGHMKLVDFRADAIGRSAIAEWSDRIHMHASDSVREFPLQPNVLEPAEVHLRLADGRTVTKLVKYAKGALQNPMSASERREKFRDCTEGLLEPCTLAELESMLARLHELSSVRELTSVLGG